MLNLETLLKEAVFAQAQVIAGAQGLQRPIEWSHIIDVPEVIDNVAPNCLIITTGQGLPETSAAQTRFIQELNQAQISGMVISIGPRLQAVPQAIVAAADGCTFPIITLPWTQRFMDITRVIHERVVSQQYALLKQSDHIHQTLSQIVLEGGGLQDLAQVLACLVKRAVTIEDPDLNLLAHAAFGEVDSAREQSIEGGGTPLRIRQYLRQEGILHEINQSLRPKMVPASPEHGMTKDRIVAPIVVERKVYGYLWLIASDNPLTEADSMAIERAAIVAALTMLKDLAVRQTEARLQADVISQLLSGEPHTLALQDKANRLGLDLHSAQRVLLLRPPEETIPNLRLADKLAKYIEPYSQQEIIQPLGQNLILILPAASNPHQVSQALLAVVPGLKIGIGSLVPDLVNLAQSHHEAEEALKIGMALSWPQSIFDFADLGFLHWLYQIPPAARRENPYSQGIKRLAHDERAARAQLLQTLEVFLDCGGNASETARVLQIHRNTLSYRLKQIETLGEISLADPAVRLNLQIAIKAYHLDEDRQADNGL